MTREVVHFLIISCRSSCKLVNGITFKWYQLALNLKPPPPSSRNSYAESHQIYRSLNPAMPLILSPTSSIERNKSISEFLLIEIISKSEKSLYSTSPQKIGVTFHAIMRSEHGRTEAGPGEACPPPPRNENSIS